MAKKKIEFLVLHCSATKEGMIVTPDDIDHWHLAPKDNPDGTVTYMGIKYTSRDKLPHVKIKGILINKLQGNGWRKRGYTKMIMLDGKLIQITDNNEDIWVDEWEITNGVAGINSISRHIMYVGGLALDGKTPKDTRTEKQYETMKNEVIDFIERFPHVKVAGHNQFANKACPSFDVPQFCREIGIPEKNIYIPEQKLF